MKLTRKKFNEYVLNVIKDFTAAGRTDLASRYYYLLENKSLTIQNITPLIDLIFATNINDLLKQGCSLYIAKEIKEEHVYMQTYLEQFFTFEQKNQIILIGKKN